MNKRYLWLIILAGVSALAVASCTGTNNRSTQNASAGGLVETVRDATEGFKDVAAAEAAGYGLFYGCVTGSEGSAMGVHFVNGDLVGDGALDPAHPEALMYAPVDGELELVGVEYVVIADAWNENNETPPVLMGQLFNLVGSPNRYGIPAFYELHVWAWKDNPRGAFSEWNPDVSCAGYAPAAGS